MIENKTAVLLLLLLVALPGAAFTIAREAESDESAKTSNERVSESPVNFLPYLEIKQLSDGVSLLEVSWVMEESPAGLIQ